MKNLILLLLLTVTFNSFAAPSVLGKVSSLYLTKEGLVLFDIEGQCRLSNSYDFALSLSDPYGKELYGFLLAAYTTQKEIRVGYWGDCNGTERIAPAQLSMTN